jgi:hypothetical protein
VKGLEEWAAILRGVDGVVSRPRGGKAVTFAE